MEKNKKKVLIISNFHEDNSISRSKIVFNYFNKKKYNAIVLYSNFSHSERKYRELTNKKFKSLKTIKYSSSISLIRLLSHFIYTIQVIKYLQKNDEELIYLILPPNLLSFIIVFKLRKKVKIIVDILDLWPEAFPHDNNIIKKNMIYIFGVFPRFIRRIAIKMSDYCITESNYFYKKLNLDIKSKSKTIYLKKAFNILPILDQISDEVSFAFLGNIGHIYDFDSLFKILLGIQKKKKIMLHIVGAGPKEKWLIRKLEDKNIPYKNHGISFDEHFKTEIFSKCWFGYNGYKDSTEVALSYKSVDYLSYGLPLINSAKEDTQMLVISNKIGYNFDKQNLDQLITKILSLSIKQVLIMKKNAFRTFKSSFSEESFSNEMDEVITSISL